MLSARFAAKVSLSYVPVFRTLLYKDGRDDAPAAWTELHMQDTVVLLPKELS